MSVQLKYVDPNRPRGLLSRAYAWFSGTRLARFISAKVVWKVDPYLLRATRGRFGLGLVLPTALLVTRGAKSGAVRRNAVIYFHDGDRVTIIASKAGYEKHPAWFHNLRAHPDVTFGGIRMRATVVEDEAERGKAVDARRPRLRALRGVPARRRKGQPDDPDCPTHRERVRRRRVSDRASALALAHGATDRFARGRVACWRDLHARGPARLFASRVGGDHPRLDIQRAWATTHRPSSLRSPRVSRKRFAGCSASS